MTLEQACPSEYQRAQCAFKDSMTHGFCNSHYLSHFAAFFIDARTKRSVVESFGLHYNYYSDDTFRHEFKRGHRQARARGAEPPAASPRSGLQGSAGLPKQRCGKVDKGLGGRARRGDTLTR
jgi:hypothetical protein